MNARDVIAQISQDMRFIIGQGWVHHGCGEVGQPDSTSLTRFLYCYYYLGISEQSKKSEPERNIPIKIVDREDEVFANKLQSAVPSYFYPSRHWCRIKSSGESHILTQNGIHLSVQAHELEFEPGKPEQFTVKMPTIRRYASAGFFAAYSAYGPADHTTPLDRVYVNVSSTTASDMLALVLEWGEEQQLPMTVKVVNDETNYDRCDTFVAYLPRVEFRASQASLYDEINSSQHELRLTTPAFTKRISPGLAWAEDPETDGFGRSSFGMHRCSLIARAIEKSRITGKLSCDDLECSILEAWNDFGLDLDQPHLSPQK
jgi:hypothetical protein